MLAAPGLQRPFSSSMIAEDETVIGWYRDSMSDEEGLLFTSDAIYIVSSPGEVQRIAIGSVLRCHIDGPKQQVAGVTVETPHGPAFLKATGTFGEFGQYRDALCLYSALRGLSRK